jgi:hypothetical protein
MLSAYKINRILDNYSSKTMFFQEWLSNRPHRMELIPFTFELTVYLELIIEFQHIRNAKDRHLCRLAFVGNSGCHLTLSDTSPRGTLKYT